ncbi:MAG: SDR family oxidoreductase [Gemmatimonadetes bacterium]|nr:SDR family oxidoreductase [Gemmatimonadota bacterium]
MILVVGATGTLGGMITRRLLDRREQVRVLVRPNADFLELQNAGAEPVLGDLKNPDSLGTALEGVDVVVTTANSAARGGEDNPQTVDLQGNRNLIDAAGRAGVKQFIFVSALGASPDSPIPFLAAKGNTEEHLRRSGMAYTILAPNVFIEVWIPMIVGGAVQAGRPVTLAGEGRRQHAFVSMDDVAAFAVAAVNNPRALNQYIAIGGPDAVSWRDVVGIFERVTGQEIPVRAVTPGEPLPGLPATVSQLAAGMESYDSPVDMSETARAYGVELTSVEEFVRRAYQQ